MWIVFNKVLLLLRASERLGPRPGPVWDRVRVLSPKPGPGVTALARRTPVIQWGRAVREQDR